MATVPPSKTVKTRPSQSTSHTDTTPGESQFWRGRQLTSCSVDSSKSEGQEAERFRAVYCPEPRRLPWHPSAVNSNVILSVSILPVSIPTLLVFPVRMRQSYLFISSTSPLTSFTLPGTGALMPQYRYVTSPPFVCMRQSDPFPSSTPPPPLPVLPYLAPGHRCLVVSVPVCNSFPPHSVLCFAAREGKTSCLYLIKSFSPGLFWMSLMRSDTLRFLWGSF